MIRLSVMYPKTDGGKFDMDYYLTKHIPLVKQRLGAALKAAAVDKGVSGGAPGSAATYVTVGHLSFDSVESFQKAFGPHSKELVGDIPNFTNIQPVMQISEIVG
jgi:uncharacterized protein (TIGR02118 family)